MPSRSSGPARAVEAVRVTLDAPVIDLTSAIERYRSDGDLIQISTAPGKDGIVRRIVVKARDAGARPDWIVFALTNDTDEQIDRILVAPHFRLVDSGVIWPDLGGSRIAAITASQGIRPGARREPGSRPVHHHAGSRHDDHLRGRAARRQHPPAPPLGPGRLPPEGRRA